MHLPRGSSVLDVGACTGTLMNKLELVGGYRMYALDINVAAVSAGIEMYTDPNLVVADAVHIPFAEDSFDCTISQDLLEHISAAELPLVMSELRRVSRGSRMIHKVTVLEDVDWIDADDTHITKRTAEWLARFFISQGFSVISNPHSKYNGKGRYLLGIRDVHRYFVLE